MHGSEDFFTTIGALECVSKLFLFFFRYKVYGTRFRTEARIFMSYLMLMKSVVMALQYFNANAFFSLLGPLMGFPMWPLRNQSRYWKPPK
jgi:hypothetical protein